MSFCTLPGPRPKKSPSPTTSSSSCLLTDPPFCLSGLSLWSAPQPHIAQHLRGDPTPPLFVVHALTVSRSVVGIPVSMVVAPRPCLVIPVSSSRVRWGAVSGFGEESHIPPPCLWCGWSITPPCHPYFSRVLALPGSPPLEGGEPRCDTRKIKATACHSGSVKGQR